MPIHSGTPPGEEDRSEASAEYARRLDELHRAIRLGVEALERGNYVEVDDADLDAFLDSLTTGEEAPAQVHHAALANKDSTTSTGERAISGPRRLP